MVLRQLPPHNRRDQMAGVHHGQRGPRHHPARLREEGILLLPLQGRVDYDGSLG